MIEKIKDKVIKTVLSLTTILSIFCGVGIPTKAASATVSSGAYTGYSATSRNADGRWVTNSNVQQILIDGAIGFCVEPGVLLSEGGGFTATPYAQRQLSIIAYEGWVRSNRTMEDYLATQFMIWEAVGGTITSTSFSNYGSYKTAIQNRINHHNDRPSFDRTNLTLKVGKKVTLTDTNGVFDQYNFVSSDGLTVSKNGNSLIITATADASENAIVKYNKIPANCVGTSILYQKAGSQSVAKFYVDDPLRTEINVKVLKYGSLKIAKQDEFGHYIPNTTFKLSYHEDMSEPIGTYITGKDGTVTVDELLAQSIYVQEVNVPNHLILDTTIHKINLVANEVTAYTQKNFIKKAKVDVIKSDNKGTQIAGAEMVVLDKDGNIIDQWTTTDEPHHIQKLYVNETYTLRELSPPEGYVLAKDVVFKTENTDKLQTIEMKDKRVSALKYDENHKPLKGATLQVISSKTKNIVDQWITDENEHYISNLLEDEDYILREIKAPNGYEIAKEIPFYVSDDKENMVLTMDDELIMTEIQIQKVDKTTKQPILGRDFAFTLYKDEQCKEKMQEVYGDKETGIASFTLSYGEYWIKETLAPTGYELSDETKHLVIGVEGIFLNGEKIDSNHDVVTFDFPNKAIQKIRTGDDTNILVYVSAFFIAGNIFRLMWYRKKKTHL